MKKFLLILAIVSSFIPEIHANRNKCPTVPLSVTEGNSGAIVDGCVSAIAGVYFESFTNLIVPGPEPLILKTSYASVPSYGWSKGMYDVICYEAGLEAASKAVNNREMKFIHSSGSGLIFSPYKKVSLSEIHSKINLSAFGKGFTNTGRGEISARTNPKNTTIISGFNTNLTKPVNAITAYSSNGEKLHFLRNGKLYKLFGPGGILYQLEKSIKPNGQSYHVFYDNVDGLNIPVRIQTGNQSESVTYASVVHTEPGGMERRFVSDDGREAVYHKNFTGGKYPEAEEFYSKLERPNSPDVVFEYTNNQKTRGSQAVLLSKRSLPNGRYKEIQYYMGDVKDNDPSFLRVKALEAPAGPNGEKVATHRFSYTIHQDGSGVTHVTDANGHLTDYFYDCDQRLSKTVRYQNGMRHSADSYTWGAKDTINAGNLLKRQLVDEEGELISERTFTYDPYGNILVDSFSGSILSEGSWDSFEKNYFYQEGRLRLLEKEEDDVQSIEYSYLPSTDLLALKMTRGKDHFCTREFYAYDENKVLIEKILDNGTENESSDLSGVTQRTITRIKPKPTTPCFGMPEEVEELYLDHGVEVLLKKVQNTYSREGWLTKQDLFDANGAHCYSVYYEHDVNGNVIKEIDALGQVTTRVFDDNNNLLVVQGPSGDRKEYQYDLQDRLIEETIIDIQGIRHTTTHSYDFLGNKISTVDSMGHEMQFRYDRFGHVIEKINPEGLTERFTYDVNGNVSSKTDSNGNTTYTLYNALSKPLKITYADNSEERFTYFANGLLCTETDRRGTLTYYTYDSQGRIKSKEKWNQYNELLCSETYTYDAFNLLSYTDPSGSATVYSYDKAGRKIEETHAGLTTTFTYDALGRVSKIMKPVAQGVWSVQCFEYDFLNRVVEERIEDAVGNVLKRMTYTYDAYGNRLTTSNYGQEVIIRNAVGRIIKERDALGKITSYNYNDRFTNDQGEQVLQVCKTDPRGVVTKTTYDRRGLPYLEEQFNSQNELLSKERFGYDPVGNLAFREEVGIVDGQEQRKHRLEWRYDDMNRISVRIENDKRVTQYKYNPAGQIETVIKPDGVKLFYAYDDLGRLKSLSSCDRTVNYRYHYDLTGNLVKIEDGVNSVSNIREYDSWGRLKSETLGNGLKITYTYDLMGRMTSFTHKNHTVHYHYDAAFLKEIAYNEFKHRFEEYDLAGNPLRETTLTGKEILRTYDLLSRPLSIESEFFAEKNIQYDEAGNVLKRTLVRKTGSQDFEYKYDLHNHLIDERAGDYHVSYVYDSLNNRVRKDSEELLINNFNELTSTNRCQYSYDLNGNLAAIEDGSNVTRYAYDALDRLIAIRMDDRLVRFTYDSFNRRLSKNGTYYLYLGLVDIGSERYQFLQEFRVPRLINEKNSDDSIYFFINGDHFFPQHDHAGNVMALVTPRGKVATYFYYTGFGEWEADGWGTTPWKFCAKRFLGKFLHCGGRDYDPETGRWNTPNPEREKGYYLSENNPLKNFNLQRLELKS